MFCQTLILQEEEKHCSIHFIPNDSIQTDSCTKHCENDREIGINIDSKLNHYSGSEFRDQKCDTSFDPKDAIQHSLKIEHDNLLVYTNCKEDHCAAVNNSTYIYEVVSLPSPNVRKATDGQQDSIDIEPSTRTDLTKEAIINDCMMDVQTNEMYVSCSFIYAVHATCLKELNNVEYCIVFVLLVEPSQYFRLKIIGSKITMLPLMVKGTSAL